MPSGSDIVVKKNDGTTDITYTFVCPASGDNTPAVFQSQTVGTAAAHHPEFRITAKDGNQGARRNLRVTYQYPQIATDSTTNLTSVVERASASCDVLVPKTMNVTDVNEFVAQFANLLKSTLIQSCLKTGYAAS